MSDVRGHQIIVTGASSGLGAHFARMLAAAGAEVVLAARRRDALEALAAEIEATGGKAQVRALDVTRVETVSALFEGLAPHGVVNNAGLSLPGTALDYPIEDWDRTMDTNLRGAFLVAQAAGRAMRGRGGSLVNVASILGLRVAGHLVAYAASKAAVVQMSRALALEWARHGVRVNALCPGYIETPLNADFFATDAGKALVARIPQRRLGQLSDLDWPLRLLLSDAGRYMTGSEIVVDGGHLVSGL